MDSVLWSMHNGEGITRPHLKCDTAKSSPGTARTSTAGRLAVCASNPIAARLERVLSTAGYELAAFTESVVNLIEAAKSDRVDAVVLCLDLGPGPWREMVQLVRAGLVGIPVVAVVSQLHSRAARKTMAFEVDGVVDQHAIERSLPAVIGCVLSGQISLPASSRQDLAEPVLSHREKQVLELVLKGDTNSQIASQLFLSESTVKSHLASSFGKLGVSSRADAARRLADLGVPLLRPAADRPA